MRVRYNAPVTLSFAFICLIVLILDQLLNGFLTQNWFSTVSFWVGHPIERHIGLLLYPFGHSGFQHFFGNMTFILLLGPIVESRMGSKALVFAIIITNLIIGVVLGITSNSMGFGASGLVFMLIAVAGLSVSNKDGIPLTFLFVVALYIFPEIFGLFGKTLLGYESGTSYQGHLLGFLSGVLIAYMLRKKEKHEVTKLEADKE